MKASATSASIPPLSVMCILLLSMLKLKSLSAMLGIDLSCTYALLRPIKVLMEQAP